MNRLVKAAIASLMAIGATGCGAPFGPCFDERVEVALNGTLTTPQGTTAVAANDQVAPGNTGDYPALRQFFIEGVGFPGQQVAWTVAGLDGTGHLSVFHPAAVSPGQVIPVNAFIQGGGWGFLPGGSTSASVALRQDGFGATQGSGSLTVLETEPFKARLSVTARNGAGEERVLSADATFGFRRERAACD